MLLCIKEQYAELYWNNSMMSCFQASLLFSLVMCHLTFLKAGTILPSIVVLRGQGTSHAAFAPFHYPLSNLSFLSKLLELQCVGGLPAPRGETELLAHLCKRNFHGHSLPQPSSQSEVIKQQNLVIQRDLICTVCTSKMSASKVLQMVY